MSFDTAARRQAKVAFDALADRLVKELAALAQDEAQAAATRAREEAERTADTTLAAARTESETQLAAAHATNAGLLQTVEATREEVGALGKRLEQAKQEHQQLVQARDEAGKRLDVETRRANDVAAHLDKQTRRVSELASQLDGEKKRAGELASQADGEKKRAGEFASQADGEKKRAHELASQLEAEKKRASQLASKIDTETRRASEVTSQFEGETRRAAELASRLDVETKRATELSSRLDGERRRTSDLASQLDDETRRAKEVAEQFEGETRRSRDLGKSLEGARQHLDVLVDRVGVALSAIDRATSPAEILETLLEPLSRDFGAVAVFLVSPTSLNGWREVGLGPATDITKVVVARDSDSLMTRAAAERKRLFAASSSQKPLVGLLGNPVARVAAMPVLAGEHVVAIVYAEDTDPSALPALGAGGRITEMLIDHANLRLTVKRPPAANATAPARYSQARQAPRVKSRDGLDLTVDGAQSALVDVSSMGAQILSPVAMKPNRTLRMLLRAGEQALACKARVIWARFEQPRGAVAARYRVGVKFTEVEEGAMDDFLARQGLEPVTQ